MPARRAFLVFITRAREKTKSTEMFGLPIFAGDRCYREMTAIQLAALGISVPTSNAYPR